MVGGFAILLIGSLKRRKILAAVACTALFWVWHVPVSWDFNTLNMAAAIYLGDSASREGEIIFKQEDATGGLTSVVETNGVRTLLTNGKFQGDNSEEVPIQHRAANIPTLFTRGRERAMVIGLGTGATLAAIAAHGFDRVVCAEISLPIIEAARDHFEDVNGGVLDRPNVTIIPEDGRSVLLERPDRYDVISVEVTTIWYAGVGSIYSREFYELASKRLRRNGVLLQWFPIHHLSAKNLFLVINTVRSVFPYVSVWTHRHQGFVIASNEPLHVDLDSVRADGQSAEMRPFFHELASGSPLEMLSDLVVTDQDVDRFLDSMARLLRADRSLVSTDTWPVIEYETPKDILENFSYFQNRAVFRRFRSRSPFAFRGEPTDEELELAQTAFSLGWQDPRAAARLARLWSTHPECSDAVSSWLLDEWVGRDVVADFPSDPLSALWSELPNVRSIASSALAQAECAPFPRFVSRIDRIPFEIGGSSGENLDRTTPETAVDGVFLPELGTGWRVRPVGSPPRLDLLLNRPRRIGRISLVVESVDGSFVRTRLFGRSKEGRWRPLASGSGRDEIACETVRNYTLDARQPELTAVRVEMQGEALSHRMTLHEIWAFGAEHTEGENP
jgi:spermidine synthase